jgi:hypothetical protein
MILFQCPGMIGPMNTATLARCQIIPLFGRERYNFMISGPTCIVYGQGLIVDIVESNARWQRL